MKTLFVSVLTLLTLTTNAFSQSPIQDPQNLLGDLDRYFGNQAFSKSFTSGDSVEIEETSCEFGNEGNGSYMECDSESEDKWVIDANKDYALFNNNLALLKSVYNKYSGNVVRFMLSEEQKIMTDFLVSKKLVNKNFTQGGLRLDSLTSTTYEVNGTHKGLRLDISIIYTDDDGATFEFPFYVIVVRDLPFMGQIAEMGFELEIDGHVLPPVMQVIDFQKN